jgi:hypothetical protein
MCLIWRHASHNGEAPRRIEAMSTQHTYEEIAEDFRLWGEYMDPNAEMTEEEFQALSTDEKVAMQVEAFGMEGEQ